MGYNRLITHGIWILHHQCVSFSSTLHHIEEKKPSLQQKLAMAMVFRPPHGKNDTGNYSASVSTPKRPLLSLSKTLASSSPPEWSSRPSKLPFTSFSSVTSSISSSLKRPFTPYAEKSTPLKSHNMPLPCIKPVTPPFPMRSITSS